MKSRIKIKGAYLWKTGAVVLLFVIIASCFTQITSVIQPFSATVGQTIPITLNVNYNNNGKTVAMVVAVLLPKGWDGAKNLTMSYTSGLGSGTFNLMPTTTTEPNSNGTLNWPASLMNTFGIGNNYINDMEWVVFVSDKQYNYNGKFSATVNMLLTVGADNANTNAVLAYTLATDVYGLQAPGSGQPDAGYTYAYYEYYPEATPTSTNTTGCLIVSGGTGGIEDFCDPQITTADPFKALTDDYITITFFGDVAANTNPALSGASNVYLNATAYDTNGKTYTVSTPSTKTIMKVVAKDTYQLTIWPRQYFGVGSATLATMAYTITDATGTKVVGVNGTTSPFGYIFRCQ